MLLRIDVAFLHLLSLSAIFHDTILHLLLLSARPQVTNLHLLSMSAISCVTILHLLSLSAMFHDTILHLLLLSARPQVTNLHLLSMSAMSRVTILTFIHCQPCLVSPPVSVINWGGGIKAVQHRSQNGHLGHCNITMFLIITDVEWFKYGKIR